MRLAVIGAGGVGGLLAGLAARAGLEVALLARGEALAAVRADGLRVTSGGETFTARPAAVSDDPAALGRCDAVLVAVKSWQVAALNGAGVVASVSEAIEVVAWEKLLFVAPFGAVGAVSRAPAGALRETPETRRLLAGLIAEGAAVARARGVALHGDVVARTLALLDGVAWGATVSMQRDLAAGRPSELQDQTGAVVRLGAEAGVPVPLHEALLAALLPLERSACGVAPRFQRT